MRMIEQITAAAMAFLMMSSCTQEDIINDSVENNPTLTRKVMTDPVIERYSVFGSVTRIDDNDNTSSDLCSSTIGIYLLTPEYGPYAGKTCEIYRFESRADMEGPCGEEYNLKWTEYEFGGYKALACPEPGDDCAELDGVNGCRLVHCDEPE